MSLGSTRKHYRAEALSTAAELIRQHGGTDAMLQLPESEQVIFDQECRRLADKLDKEAMKYID